MGNTQAMVERIAAYRAGAAVSQMIVLGDCLGLYVAMRGAGAVTATELAARIWPEAAPHGLAVRGRWLREWLLGQVAAGIAERVDVERFALPDVAAAVLADEDSLASLIGTFDTVAVQSRLTEHVAHALRTGEIHRGVWESADSVAAVERMRRPWIKGILVSLIVPSLSGVGEKLEQGVTVADLCCGSGLSTIELALAYPKSEFIGYDSLECAVSRARAKAERDAIANVRFELTDACEVAGQGPFDLILTLDAIHEVADPVAFARAVRAAISPDGVWLIEDPSAGAADTTLAALYAGSVLTCLPAALPTAGDAALGSVGFTEEYARNVCRDARFSRFRSLALGMAAYNHFEVRP